MESMAAGFQHLGNPDVTPELKKTITDGVQQEAGHRSIEELAQEENELLVGLIRLRAHQGRARGVEEHA